RAGKVQAVPPHLRSSDLTQASDRAKGAVGGARVEGYVYAHDEPDAVAQQQYLPDDLHAELAERSYYRPTDRGFEARLQDRWSWLRGRRRGRGGGLTRVGVLDRWVRWVLGPARDPCPTDWTR